MKAYIFLAFLASGCRPAVSVHDSVVAPDTEDTDTPGDTSEPETVPGDTGPDDTEDESDLLYTLDRVHTAALTVSDAGMDSLRRQPYEFVAADLVFDDVPYAQVAIRIKGRLGSLRSIDDKPALKVDLNAYVAGRGLYRQERINLNNMVQDRSCVHEWAAYEAFRAAGVPAPRVGYVHLTLNDLDYGLYTVVEVYDDVFLGRNYAEPDGNLYDGDYYMMPNGDYVLIDFMSHTDDYFQLDEGTDVALADIHAITAAVNETGGTSRFEKVVGTVVDLDEHRRMWAAEAWTGHYDSYSFNRNNFRVYIDPADGLADMWPWDTDWAFDSSTPLTSPSGMLTYHCRQDPACHDAFRSILPDVMAQIDAADLDAGVSKAVDLIWSYVQSDPRRGYRIVETQQGINDLHLWIADRTAQLAAMPGL